ncbi:transcriptional regulator NagR [soil metagenome]
MAPSPGPRYEEIAAYVRELVSRGRPGDRLPSDAELCDRFGVSRMTARQAVAVLANERLLERRKGSGTYISPRRVPRTLGSPLSFTESMRRRGMEASSRLLHRGEVDVTDDEADALGLRPSGRAHVLERLRLADGVPMAIERVVMPLELATVVGDDAESSLHQAFERAGRIPTQALATVSAQPVTRRQSELLELAPTGIVLSELRTISDQDGVPLERTKTLYAAERYAFEAVLYRDHDVENR